MVLNALSTGSMENIGHLIGRPGFEYRIASATDFPLVIEPADHCGYEVFPTTVLETNAQGTPVIGHRLGPLPEMLEGRGGLTYRDEVELIGAATKRSDVGEAHSARAGARSTTPSGLPGRHRTLL